MHASSGVDTGWRGSWLIHCHQGAVTVRHVFALLLLSLVCVAARAQQTLIAGVPPDAPTTTQLRAPNGLSSHAFLRVHLILTASDLAALPAGTDPVSIGFRYADGVGAPAAGSFRVYLENTADTTNLKSTTWTTAIATMTQVYDGTLALPESTAPTNVDVDLNAAPFTYTGGGLYVAYEYAATSFSTPTDPATYAANSALAGATRMASSAAAMPSTLSETSAFRPQIRIGRANPFGNELAVEAVSVKYGALHALWDDEITATVANRGRDDRTQVAVQMQVSGANSEVRDIVEPLIAAGDSAAFVATALGYGNTGTQTVTVSVPADENPANDQRTLAQAVSCDMLAYADDSAPFDSIGFNTGSGILAMRYTAPPVPIVVSAVTVGISDAPTNLGQTVAGRLLDASGQIVATAPDVVLNESHLGAWVVFPLDAPVTIAAGEILHAGLLQRAGSPGYFPVATNAPALVAPDRVFSFPADGGAGTMYTDLGTLRIGLQASAEVALVRTADTPPEGEVVTYTATPGYGDYLFVRNGDTVQQGPDPAYSFSPSGAGDLVTVTATRNACAASVDAVEPVREYTVTSSVSGGNGTITPAEQLVPHSLDAGGSLTPDLHYHLDTLSGDTCSPVDDGAGGWTATNITDDCAVTASFALDTYAVALQAEPMVGGTLAVLGGVDLAAVPHGTSIDLLATPAAGWDVADIGLFPPTLDCGGSVTTLGATLQPDGSASFAATIESDCTVTAFFANQAPDFTPGAPVTALVSGAPVAIADWATDLRSGDGPGATQALSFELTPLDIAPPGAQLFAVGGEPSIDATGTLRFAPGTDAGSATYRLVLRDDAGIANGGSDVSPERALTIRIATDAIDLSIQADVPATRNYPGDRIAFSLAVSNGGPGTAIAAGVLWTPPLELTDVEWICEAQGPSTCAASGSGAIGDTVSVSAGSRVDYFIQATLPPGDASPPAVIPASASVVPAADQADADSGDDTATWLFRIDGLFRDGLEAIDAP